MAGGERGFEEAKDRIFEKLNERGTAGVAGRACFCNPIPCLTTQELKGSKKKRNEQKIEKSRRRGKRKCLCASLDLF